MANLSTTNSTRVFEVAPSTKDNNASDDTAIHFYDLISIFWKNSYSIKGSIQGT